jgi:hypothetical protein
LRALGSHLAEVLGLPADTVTAIADCWSCGEGFSFDPSTVPVILIDPDTNLPPDLGGTDPAHAVRQPLCNHCIELANQRRVAAGQPPFPTSAESSR